MIFSSSNMMAESKFWRRSNSSRRLPSGVTVLRKDCKSKIIFGGWDVFDNFRPFAKKQSAVLRQFKARSDCPQEKNLCAQSRFWSMFLSDCHQEKKVKISNKVSCKMHTVLRRTNPEEKKICIRRFLAALRKRTERGNVLIEQIYRTEA